MNDPELLGFLGMFRNARSDIHIRNVLECLRIFSYAFGMSGKTLECLARIDIGSIWKCLEIVEIDQYACICLRSKYLMYISGWGCAGIILN